MIPRTITALTLLFLSGCTVLHHAQLGEIDNRDIWNKRKFEIKVSETGVNLKNAGQAIRQLTGSKGAQEGAEYLSWIQMGPKTGNPIYNEGYARKIYEQVRAACPSGKVTGLESVRENRDYQVISGEIVKVTGYCLSSKGGSAAKKRYKKKKRSH
jgi:hypothetical protein